MGGKSPVQGRPAEPRKLCRGAARSGGAPAWETGAVVLGRLGSCEGLLGGTVPWPKALEKGVVLENGQDDGVQRRARAGRPAAFKGGRGWCCGVGRLPRSTRGPWQARLAGGQAMERRAIRRGTTQ
jgi:hypothetical protein